MNEKAGSTPAVMTTDAGDADTIIRIDHITKVFQDKKQTVVAVDDVSFDVCRGEIFGLLGPNGAGKSTLIRILTTLLRATSGTAWVGGHNIAAEPQKIRSIIGVCPQNSTLDVELTAYDNLEFYGKLERVPEEMLDGRIWELLEMSELADRATMKVQTFSGGMRRKLEIVRAFIHKPVLLFLDEPTIGLDPEARREVWQQIAKLNAEKTTIILTTHYMDEAEKLCSRIAFVDRGRLVALDTMENLRKLIPAGDLIEIVVEKLDERALRELGENPLVNSVSVLEQRVTISATNGSSLLPILFAIFERFSLPIVTISIRTPSLEDVFIYLTGKKLDSGGEGNQGTNPRGGRRP